MHFSQQFSGRSDLIFYHLAIFLSPFAGSRVHGSLARGHLTEQLLKLSQDRSRTRPIPGLARSAHRCTSFHLIHVNEVTLVFFDGSFARSISRFLLQQLSYLFFAEQI